MRRNNPIAATTLCWALVPAMLALTACPDPNGTRHPDEEGIYDEQTPMPAPPPEPEPRDERMEEWPPPAEESVEPMEEWPPPGEPRGEPEMQERPTEDGAGEMEGWPEGGEEDF